MVHRGWGVKRYAPVNELYKHISKEHYCVLYILKGKL